MERKRMGVTIGSADSNSEPRKMLMLNEVFLAEKDSSKVSQYKLVADGSQMGRFQSSGIIISSGTGSSGWLYGAKRSSA